MGRQLRIYKFHIMLVIALIGLGSIVYGLSQQVTSVTTEKYIIQVKPGMAARDIGELLYKEGIIKNVFLFQVVSKVQGMQNSLQAGEYIINNNMTMQQIITMLGKGETTYQLITIPEGYTVEQVATSLQTKNIGSAATFKKIAQDFVPYAYMATQNANTVYKTEGYLFPDTYRIGKGATEEQILSMMTTQFDKQFDDSLRARTAELGLSIQEAVILASLVEKEAQLSEDRPIIAGVFLNRLKLDMPLQSCATIQYILGYPKAELTVRDTEIPSPYNTYLHPGLPPGPIANPGMAALQAVLYPKKTEYLYFVADKEGAHHFSKTYEEHLIAIEQVSR